MLIAVLDTTLPTFSSLYIQFYTFHNLSVTYGNEDGDRDHRIKP